MNLLLIQDEEREGQGLCIRGERAKHLIEVLKVKAGDQVRVGLARQSSGFGTVTQVGSDTVRLGSLELRVADPAPKLRLILALPRPKALRRTLQTAASFGVAHIDLVNAWRVNKSYWDSPALEEASLEQQLRLGCEQGRHPWLPRLACHRLLVPFLDAFEAGPQTCLLAQPGSAQWIGEQMDLTPATCLAIGPEGGWIESELQSFARAGFRSVAISNAILRSEIALAAALAQLQLCLR